MACFEQTCLIAAPVAVVDRCLTQEALMKQWLNPLLACASVGAWDCEVGGRFRFYLRVPLIQPTLDCRVIERGLGLVVWAFDGFFTGTDRWQAVAVGEETRLLNRFEFAIPNPLVSWGFQGFAAFTQQDMVQQLGRVRRIAEREYGNCTECKVM